MRVCCAAQAAARMDKQEAEHEHGQTITAADLADAARTYLSPCFKACARVHLPYRPQVQMELGIAVLCCAVLAKVAKLDAWICTCCPEVTSLHAHALATRWHGALT